MTAAEPKKRDRRAYNAAYALKHKERLAAYKKTQGAAWYAANKKSQKTKNRAWYLKNKDVVKAANAAWLAANPEKAKEMRAGINARFYARNREREKARSAKCRAGNLERNRELAKKWARENPDKAQAIKTRRKARKIAQLHPDLDLAKETELFLTAQRMSQETGELHHVDHIIPLIHGGWHHHDNLQVLTGAMNVSKHSDPFWEKEGFKSWKDVPCHLWPAALETEYRIRMIL